MLGNGIRFLFLLITMKFEAFSSLMRNKGDSLEEISVYRIPVDTEDYNYKYIMKQIPEGCSGKLYEDYLWLCFQEKNKDGILQDLVSRDPVFVGEVEQLNINLISDEYWQPLGYGMIKSAIINKAYNSGPYFKNDDGDICLGRAIEENKGRKVFAGLKMRFYRTKERNNFYASFDLVSKLEVESGAPEQWKDDKNFVNLTPESEERISRLNEVLKPMKSEKELLINMNNSQICFNSNLGFDTGVKRK